MAIGEIGGLDCGIFLSDSGLIPASPLITLSPFLHRLLAIIRVELLLAK
jgi:hypothetical protein